MSRATRTSDNGFFSFGDLPPGPYRLLARTTSDAGGVLAASAELSLDGEDVHDLALSMQAGITITGLIVFRGDSPPPVFGTLRSTPLPLSIALGNARYLMPPLQIDGVRFKIDGVIPGEYRMGGNLLGLRTPIGGWWLQSLAANGVELLDAPLELRHCIDGAIATFSDKASELLGRVTGPGGTPLSGATVVAFPVDRAGWFRNSRRVAGVRSDGAGRYTIRNLPPGEYRLAAAMDLDPGEWFDPAVLERLLPIALPLTIADVERRTIDLAIR
jgi:hypothetical protein